MAQRREYWINEYSGGQCGKSYRSPEAAKDGSYNQAHVCVHAVELRPGEKIVDEDSWLSKGKFIELLDEFEARLGSQFSGVSNRLQALECKIRNVQEQEESICPECNTSPKCIQITVWNS